KTRCYRDWSSDVCSSDLGTTILLTTQYLDEADRLAHQIVVIDYGKVIAEGTSDELKDQLGGDVVEVRVASSGDLDKALAAVAGRWGARSGGRCVRWWREC